VVTPILIATALGREKENGTLAFLLDSGLTAWEIVVGKLLGRLTLLIYPALASLPGLTFLSVLMGLELAPLLLAYVQASILAFVVASASMLCSVWTRRVSDALLLVYGAAVAACIVMTVRRGGASLGGWLNPLVILNEICNGLEEVKPLAYLLHIGFWLGVGGVFLVVAVNRLVPAHLRHLDRRPLQRRWARRPPVSDDPVAWRERYVLGLAPLPWLRGVPSWLARLGVLGVSASLAYWLAITSQRTRGPTISSTVCGVNLVFLALSCMAVTVRCAVSIPEENWRKTWEDLLLTPLSLTDIVRSKRRGIIQAAVPYLVAFGVPMLALAARGGQEVLLLGLCWLAGNYVALWIAAVFGKEVTIGTIATQESPHYKPAARARARRADRTTARSSRLY
jgi:hypothetical protein